jgi:N-acetylmuramoyl-L-alanine amidase
VIVIDAGHGGKDPGTIGRKSQEKNIALAIALKLGKLISTRMKEVKVIYTRDKDEFVELYERAGIANRNKADLFISIHCNANRNKALHGAETYIMGLHRSEANLETAKKENASILMETDHSARYQGFDPNSDESYIIFTLYQDANLGLSLQLATDVQAQMGDRVRQDDHGVRQAGFLVLYKTTMPSLLVETGYLSNAQEEQYLMSEKGQQSIAEAIFRAVQQYREGKGIQPTAVVRRDAQDTPPPPAVAKTEASSPARVQETTTDPPRNDHQPQVSFRVQVYTSPKEIPLTSKRFSGLRDVRMYRHQGMYKYTTGNESTPDAAFSLLSQVKKKGFRDAFVVAFSDGQRISMEKARALLAQ